MFKSHPKPVDSIHSKVDNVILILIVTYTHNMQLQ
jgi:hypothetical protein